MALNPEEKKARAEKRKQDKWNKLHKIKNDIIYKWCNYGEHWVEENDDNFYRSKSNSVDGYHPDCIECSIAKTQIWQVTHPEEYQKAINKRNKFPSEKRLKTLARLGKEKRERGYDAEYRKTHKERVNGYSLKRKEKNHRITDKEWYDCKLYFNFRCAYCGLAIEEHWITRNKKLILMDLHKEHVIWDGKDNLKNCVPSCQSCNSLKHKSSLNNWYNSKNELYTYERYYKIYEWLHHDYKKFIKKRKPKQKYNSKV
jgi:hypothetical protein